ncbi:long-chain-fatty-acid--CoA ligase [Variovorax sp. GT1P44]|uniref:long-chain-fatty-acid--CoA ligase n=1 Tax=Variovorax sp. GT1P44 TaxID=3443742 RepID=UPI003F4714E7
MYLTQSFHRAISTRPGAIASVYRDRRRTFAQMGDRVARLAGALRKLGLQPGDRVGMLALNSDRYLEYYMAVYWAGCAVNPANIRWSAAEIAFSLDDCDTRVLIVDDQFAPMVPELLRRSVALRTLIHAGDGATPEGMLSYETLIAESEPAEDAGRGGSDLAGVFYTGGTTGFPKGVMLSHAGLYVNALAIVAEGAVRDGDIGLHAAPMFHLADGAFMNAMFACGGTHVMIPAFTPLAVLEAIGRDRITASLLVPTMIQMTVDHPEVPRHDLSSLRSVIYGASPISEALIDRATRALPRVGFFQAYGMTELSPVATMLRPEFHTREGRALGKVRSAGRPTYCVELRIEDIDGSELPRGEVGEIAVKGPGMMLGYWNRPEESAQALRGGWMHTGDAGRMDEEGFVFVVDRIKDMIVTGGENVYSVEVENAVLQHASVAACAVIGIPCDKWGEQVHAVVVLKAGAAATGEDIQAHCKTLIANYKCPRSIEFIAALPLSGAGKVLKTALRAPHWEGRERAIA